MAATLPRICLLSTGGTISMVRDASSRLVPSHDESALIGAVPTIGQVAQVTHHALWQEDSANLQPADWATLARAVYERYDAFDGFVIAHGTDTLAYAAAALSYYLQELGKPVVMTGAQIPLSEVGSDGPSNLVNAFRVATADLAEVCVVFGTAVIRGTKVRKVSAFDLEAFESINCVPLGRIGLRTDLIAARTRRAARRPILDSVVEPAVALVMVYPGMAPELLDFIGQSHRGVVLLGYGVGNLPTHERSLIPAVRRLAQSGVAVVVGTQCTVGRAELGHYGGGQQEIEAAGAIPALDMTPEAALVKLMWVLGHTRDPRTVASMMLKSYAGEISAPTT